MRSLIEDFISTANEIPDSIAIKVSGSQISYGMLKHYMDMTAVWLSRHNIVKGDRVGIHIPNSIEYIIIYYACWRAGVIPVALNTYASKKELDFWLQDSGCKIFFSKKIKATFLEKVLLYDISLSDDNLRINKDIVAEIPDDTIFTSPSMDDIASLIYTSGTTGNPKGITLLHKNIAVNINAIIKSLNISSGDNFLCVLPFFYSFGNSILHTHMVSGSTLVLLNQVSYPIEILRAIERESCNGFAGVPSIYISLLKKIDFKKFDLSSLRYMTQAGGPLSKEFIEEIHTQLPFIDFVVMYGQTEASARISYLPPKYLEKKAGSVGFGVEGVTITVLDNSGHECRPGETGEICVSGDSVMAGYWNNPVATEQVLINGQLHTGDMGYKDQQGFLYIVGRQAEILKISEHRVSPYEIEEVILKIEGVVECAVIGCSHEQMGQFAKAYVVKNSSEVTANQIRKYCKQSLAGYKIPKTIEFVETLPKTSSGKIKRTMLTC